MWVDNAVEAASKEEQSQIITIVCPKCTTPIRRSKRYVRILSQRAADIEKVGKFAKNSGRMNCLGG